MKKIYLFITCFFISQVLLGQVKETEEKTTTYAKGILIAPTFSFYVPGAETAHRFGVSTGFGMSLGYKFGKNWSITGEGNFIFGKKVKETGHIIATLVDNGLTINSQGFVEEVDLSQRGAMMRAIAHRTFNFNSSKPNSGFQVGIGAGYFMNRILIDVDEDVNPQLSGDYVKGYDRMTHGLAISEYVGLIKLEKGKYVNLSFGLEFVQGITRSARAFDFYQGRKLDKTRFELMFGAKLSWIIPVFNGESTSSDYYYY